MSRGMYKAKNGPRPSQAEEPSLCCLGVLPACVEKVIKKPVVFSRGLESLQLNYQPLAIPTTEFHGKHSRCIAIKFIKSLLQFITCSLSQQ